MLAQFQKDYPNEVRFVFRHFPLSFHDKSSLAAKAAEAASLQDKFFEMEEAFNAAPAEWNELTVEEFEEYVNDKAVEIGLDMTKFAEDLKSDAVAAAVQEDYDGGVAAGVNGTPTVYMNGSLYSYQNSYEMYETMLKLISLKERQYTECPPTIIDQSKNYTATLKTEKGDIVIELYDDIAPVTVNSFVFLAQEGWFDNIIFHRVISGFVAQTGDPLGSGIGGPGYNIKDEIDPDYTYDEAGVVGMANSGANTNGSQFFIAYGALPDLDGGYTVFGKVIKGMDVVESLTPRDPTSADVQPAGDKIISVVITEE